jgi:nitrite reductase/ring-hydroxylating ferredoxin subunit
MSSWAHLIKINELPPGQTCEVVVEENVLAVFNLDGEFKVLEGICPHQGGPLGKGTLSGCIVTCPWHGWQFNTRTGQQQINARIVHPTYTTRIDGENVLVQLPA